MADGRNYYIELGFNSEEQAAVDEAAALLKVSYLDALETAFKIGRGLVILQKRFSGTGQRGEFADALVQCGFVDRAGGPMQKSIRSNYTTLFEQEAKVRAWWKSVPEKKKRFWMSVRAIHRHWTDSNKPKIPDALKKPTPFQRERATNVTLQEQLHAANERLKTADGGNLFDLDHDTVEHVGTVIGARWRATPSRIRRLIEVLTVQAKEAEAAVKAARPLGGSPGRRTRHGRVVKS
jgi:hypothetical protein